MSESGKILQGVAIGITVAVILELSRYFRMLYLRKKQKNHLREIIEKAQKDVHGMNAFASELITIPEEISRVALILSGKVEVYHWLISELQIILREGAEGLTYKQKYELSSFVFNHTRMVQALFGSEERTHTSELLTFHEKNVFPKLREIKWLKLRESDLDT